jgi:hypothetical protein
MFSAPTTVGGFTFNAGAPQYSFLLFGTLTLNGNGIVNNSSNAPGFLMFGGAVLTFSGPSSAGNATMGSDGTVNFRNTSSAANAQLGGGLIHINFFDTTSAASARISGLIGTNVIFNDNSRAGNATITMIRSTLEFHNSSSAENASIVSSVPPGSGGVLFAEQATAGNATIDNRGGSPLRFNDLSSAGTAKITNAGSMSFGGSSTAASSSILNNFKLDFGGTSTAANAMITMNSGATTTFFGASTGGAARVILNGTAILDISPLTSAGMTLGSIEEVAPSRSARRS